MAEESGLVIGGQVLQVVVQAVAAQPDAYLCMKFILDVVLFVGVWK